MSSHQSCGTGQEAPADDSGWSVSLCVMVPLLSLGQPLLGTGKCSVSGCCPFPAQLLSPVVFLATSNEASQPNACPLIFAVVIHPPGCSIPWLSCGNLLASSVPAGAGGWGAGCLPQFVTVLCPLLLLQQVHLIVGQALKRYSEDRVGMVDYALESAGRWSGQASCPGEVTTGCWCAARLTCCHPLSCQGPASSTLAAQRPTRHAQRC